MLSVVVVTKELPLQAPKLGKNLSNEVVSIHLAPK